MGCFSAVRSPARCILALGGLALLVVSVSLASGRFPYPATHRSPYAGRVGLSSHLTWYSEAYDNRQLATEKAGGIDWARVDFLWSRIEPRRGVFRWRATDAYMAAAARNRMHVLAILTRAPEWAFRDPGSTNPNSAPARPADYAAFARAVAARYGARGSFWKARRGLAAVPLAAVELWNEPFGYWSWGPRPSPRAYAAFAHAAAVAVRHADPTIRILMPGDPVSYLARGTVGKWLSAVLSSDPGLPRLIDAYSVHAYPDRRNASPWANSRPRDRSFAKVLDTRQIAAARSAAKPIWITEIGWSTAPGLPDAVSEATQASYEIGAIKRAIGRWGKFVRRIFIYAWAPSTSSPTDFSGNLPLLRSDGTPKPAWLAIERLLAG